LVSSAIAAAPRVRGSNTPSPRKEAIVPNKDEAEGRIKEAAGDLIDDKDERQGGDSTASSAEQAKKREREMEESGEENPT
jgi:uncharacterized protein YjbJ (UPF0337 family)